MMYAAFFLTSDVVILFVTSIVIILTIISLMSILTKACFVISAIICVVGNTVHIFIDIEMY